MIYRNFEVALQFIRKLNIRSATEWRKYAYSSERPKDIPSHPDQTYKNSGWKGWEYWLGTKRENMKGSYQQVK